MSKRMRRARFGLRLKLAMPGLAQFVAWNQMQTSAALLGAALVAGFWMRVWRPSNQETRADVGVADAPSGRAASAARRRDSGCARVSA